MVTSERQVPTTGAMGKVAPTALVDECSSASMILQLSNLILLLPGILRKMAISLQIRLLGVLIKKFGGLASMVMSGKLQYIIG